MNANNQFVRVSLTVCDDGKQAFKCMPELPDDSPASKLLLLFGQAEFVPCAGHQLWPLKGQNDNGQ